MNEHLQTLSTTTAQQRGNEANEYPALAVSPKIARKMLNVGHTRIYQHIKAGDLVVYKDGRNTKITVASIHAYITRRIAESSPVEGVRRCAPK